MKRVSSDQKIGQLKLAKRRERRRLVRLKQRAARRRSGLPYYEQKTARNLEAIPGSTLVVAPAILSLAGGSYASTIGFLNKVKKVAFTDNVRVVLDLRNCQKITPEMAPLLSAEYNRVSFFKGRSAISGVSPDRPEVRNILHGMGFFESVQVQDPGSIQDDADFTPDYTIKTGTSLDGEITKRVADDFAEALTLSEEQREKVHRALNEALENISEHAYSEEVDLPYPAEPGRWWISSVAFKEQKAAYLLACDFGSTIPATVPKTAAKAGEGNVAFLQRFLKDGNASTDQKLLAAAFEEGVTRRPDGKGGFGLARMASLVHEFPEGQLTVFSGSAAAMVSTANELKTLSLPRRFDGTYVLWHLKQEAA